MIAMTPAVFAHGFQQDVNAKLTGSPYSVAGTRCKRQRSRDTGYFRCTAVVTDRRRHRTTCVEMIAQWDGYDYWVWGNARTIPCRDIA